MKRINGGVFHYKVIKNIGFVQNFNYILPKQTKISNFAYLNAELKNSKQIMNTSKGIHTHKRTALAGLLTGVLLTASCSYREEKAIEQSVVGFAQNYFNLRYHKALNACTPESEKWVRFKATNITQEDVDVYNSKRDTAECDVESIDLDDDKATAIVEVRNFLNCDSIGKPATICPNAKFKLELKKQGEKWMVDVQSPITTCI